MLGAASALGCNAISGVGDYQFGGEGAASTATGSGGGGGSTGGTGGGQPSGGGGAGADGGSGGVGGATPTLVDRGLVVRYYMDEADSGQDPTELFDAAPNPLNLAITYATELTFTDVSSNRGLNWSAHGSSGDARVAPSGTKFYDQLHDVTAVTIEVVVDVTDLPVLSNRHFTTVGPGGNAGNLSLLTSGDDQIRLAWQGGTSVGSWTIPITTLGRVTLHAVLDTSQATATERARLFIDGLAAAASSATPPAQGATVDLSGSTGFVIGNGVGSTTLSIDGTIFYVAYYAAALSAQEVVTNAEILGADDDTP